MDSQPSMIIALLSSIRKKANQFLEQELERRHLHGILPAHGPLLKLLLDSAQPIRITEVAQAIGRANSTVTVMIEKLEKEGYLCKKNSQKDNRVVYLEATARLRAIAPDLSGITRQLQEKTYKNMSAQKQQALLKLLNEIHGNLEA